MPTAAELKEIVDDLATVLEYDEDDIVLMYGAEPSPYDLEFIYEPSEADMAGVGQGAPGASESGAPSPFSAPAPSGTNQIFGGSAPAQDSGPRAPMAPPPTQTVSPGANSGLNPALSRAPAPRKPLQANAGCTVCGDRLFPVKNYIREGEGSILVLHYNGPIKPGQKKPDRSQQYIFGTPEEDDLFDRMLKAAELSRTQVHFQEYPGCFFNPDRSLAEEWNDRCRNCLSHVLETVRKKGIRLLLVTGPAAVFLLGEDKAKELSLSGEALPIELEEVQVPALVIRSPAALLALEKKRKRVQQTGDKDSFEKTVAEEKAIKTAILTSLKKARTEFGAG